MKRFLALFFLSLWGTICVAQSTQRYQPQYWHTKNGTQVVFYHAPQVPMLDISMAFAAGSAYDEEDFGLSALTTELLDQGNAGLNATDIAERLADTGAQYDAETTRDMAVFHLKTLTEPDALKQATDIFACILQQPDFQEDAFNREKNQQLMAIAHMQESPDEMANQTFFKVLYNNHPYAHPILGTEDRTRNITLEAVRRFYETYFVSNNAVLVLVGAIDTAKAHELADKLTTGLRTGQHAPNIPNAKPLPEALDVEVAFPSTQSIIRLGQLGIDHHNPNYFPLLVGNYILGGGALVSQLATEIRHKRGLTYGVYSQFVPMPGLGPFVISLSTQTKQAETATNLARRTLTHFLEAGPTEKELTAAKQYLTGNFPLTLASNQNIANTLLKMAFYNLPKDYLDTYTNHINQVNHTEIQQSFQQLIAPNQLLQVTVGQS